MQSIPASVILEDAYRMIGWDPTELDPREIAMARQAFSLALQEVWERWWWEELMVSRQIYFAGDAFEPYPIIYEPLPGSPMHSLLTDGYYVNLWPAGPPVIPTGKCLATDYDYFPGPTSPALQPVTSNTDNLYGWARYNPHQQRHALPIWNAQMNPALGDQVQWAGNVFQWCTDQGYLPNNQPDPTKTILTVNINPGWIVVTKWQPTLPFNAALSGYPAIPAGYFGDIFAVTKKEFPQAPYQFPYPFRPSEDGSGVVIPDWDLGGAWIYARRPTPIITGDPYVSSQAYDATTLTDLVWDS